jgi:Leucine-rich repeat (LRR) protein
LIARGIHVQTVEDTAWESTQVCALGATDFQLPVDARFGVEGWRSRRRHNDIQTGDRLFDDAILVEGDSVFLRRLLEREPARLAIRKCPALRINGGIVKAQAWENCNVDVFRVPVTVLTWALSLVAQGATAPHVDGEVCLPWLYVLSTDPRTLTITGDRVDPRHLGAVTSLRTLRLSDVVLTSGDLMPFTSLTELQTLELVRVVQVRDLMPLGHMLWLRGLSLAGCSVEDVTPIARLTNLEALDLCQTQVRDLSPLAALTGLKQLHLTEMAIDDASLAFLRKQLPALTVVTEADPTRDREH